MPRHEASKKTTWVNESPLGVEVSTNHDAVHEDDAREVTVYIPGIGETAKNNGSFLKPVKEHAEQSGMDVLCFENDDESISDEALEFELIKEMDRARLEWESMPQYLSGEITDEQLAHAFNAVRLNIFRHAYNFVQFLDAQQEQGTGFKNIVAHSQGAVVVSLAALFWPKRFSHVHVVLVNPAGWAKESEQQEKNKAVEAAVRIRQSRIKKLTSLVGEKSSRHLLVGYYRSLIVSLIRGNVGIVKDSAKHLFTDFFGRFGEAKEIDDIDIIPIMQLLHKNGTQFSLLYGEADALFNKERYEERLNEVPFIKTSTHQGGHFRLVEKPKEVVRQVRTILHS